MKSSNLKFRLVSRIRGRISSRRVTLGTEKPQIRGPFRMNLRVSLWRFRLRKTHTQFRAGSAPTPTREEGKSEWGVGVRGSGENRLGPDGVLPAPPPSPHS